MKHRSRTGLAGSIAMLLCAAPVLADEGVWLEDLRTGCKIWSDEKLPDIGLLWHGECVDDKASGDGSLEPHVRG